MPNGSILLYVSFIEEIYLGLTHKDITIEKQGLDYRISTDQKCWHLNEWHCNPDLTSAPQPGAFDLLVRLR